MNRRFADEIHVLCRDCVNRDNEVQRGKKTPEELRQRWREQAAAFRAKNPRKAAANQRKALYGISQEQFDEMIIRQLGLCAICGHAPMGKGANGSLHIDHDHDTGRIRGLLCQACNLALGGFKDDAQLLRKAVEYLGA